MARVVALVALVILLMVASAEIHVSALGVNWGNHAFNPLPPKDVVKLMQINGIKKAKIFDADYDMIRSMAGSGIEVMVAAPNNMLYSLANDPNAATAWVKQNVTQFLFQGGVDIKWVAVGNEPFLTAYNNSYLNTTYPALRNIQTALDQAGHSEVRAIIPFNADVLTDSPKPSGSRFKPEYISQIQPMLEIFNRTGAPFSVNLYPYISKYQNPDFPLDYAFFSGTTSPNVDGTIVYQNALDASLDGLITALGAAGYPNMAVMLGEIGWPTDGAPFATVELAGRYMQDMITHLQSGVGTPLRPNSFTEFYLFGLLDENWKSILPGPFERSWGVFYYDGIPKYPLNLNSGLTNLAATTLKALDYPPYMKAQFCVLNDAAVDKTNLTQNVQYACERSDCTALNPGSTCSMLTENASYAFNSYYQSQNQDMNACDFQGFAKVVTTNPSQGLCRFPLSLVPTAKSTSGASTLRLDSGVLALTLAASLVSALWTMAG
ncbi:hypothetical protein KC19_1G217600 [Ceratodon purpureus]|uniref:X8 domain-containing protein n=1 Tax=Ceratodon purpureus TaxID=3225 RepID=A0A8T0J7X4_CERPU|nr:hypothetical protein KC19_1G217600 [Ceratodon purpureus]